MNPLKHPCVEDLLNTLDYGLRKYQRLLVEEVGKLVGRGGVVIAEIPAGYGKTLIPVVLAASLVTEGVVGRVIHTYPATSMIEHLLRKDGSEVEALRKVWVKALGIDGGAGRLLVGARHMFRHESPLLTNPYVVTTLDTLTAHYLKTFFAEASRSAGRGAYSEFSAGVVHSSLLVFDEAHMYPVVTEAVTHLPHVPVLGKAFNVMAHIMGKHAEVGGASLLMTATMPEPLLQGIKEVLARYGVAPTVIRYDEGLDDPPGMEGSFLGVVKARRYEAELREVRGKGELINAVAREAVRLARRGLKVLVTMNTVSDAVATYLRVKEALSGSATVALAHSRYTLRDREEIVESVIKAGESEGGSVLVATQVVEASIDISMDALLSDVAPLDSIAQRLGRVCRPGHVTGECVGVVKVFVNRDGLRGEAYGPYDASLVRESLETLKEIRDGGWRELSEFSVTPGKWVSEAYGKAYAPTLLPHEELLDFLESVTIRTSPALMEEWVQEEFGGFVRDEDLCLAALVSEDVINAYLRGRDGGADRLKEGVRGAVEDGLIVKAPSHALVKVLKGAGIEEVPVARVGLGDVYLARVGVSDERRLRLACRGGTYVVIPEELYDCELGLIHAGGGE